MARRLTLIAGVGSLPVHILAAAERNGDTVQVLTLGGRNDMPGASPVTVTDPAGIIGAIRAFKSTHVTVAGAVQLADAEREGLARAFGGSPAAATGDGALSALGQIVAMQTGAQILGPHEIAGDLLAARGHIAGPKLDEERSALAAFALRKARDVGALDLGQAVVTAGKRIIAAEDVAGTDALLERVRLIRAAGLTGGAGNQLVLAKATKPGQPLNVDLPAIGPKTIEGGQAAGIAILVVEAGKTLLLDRVRLVFEADRLGVAVLAMDAGDG